MAKATHIVFDKTGTLTSTQQQDIHYEGTPLTAYQQQLVAALASCSNHPLSKALAKQLGVPKNREVTGFKETTGMGVEGYINGELLRSGSYEFVAGKHNTQPGTTVYISINNKVYGFFLFSNHYREAIPGLLNELKNEYRLSVLSGDNEAEKVNLERLLGRKATLLFHQKPEDKLQYIQQLQQQGEKVMMIGDGLNDAGALKQSDIGIAVAEQTNNFTPPAMPLLKPGSFQGLPNSSACAVPTGISW